MSSDYGRFRLRRCVRRAGPYRLRAIGFGLILPACGDDDPVGPSQQVESIIVTAVSTTDLEAIDATVQLEATGRNADGDPVSGVDFEGSSNDEALATVDDTGLVTAASNGSATITESADGASGEPAGKIDVAVIESDGSLTPIAGAHPPYPVGRGTLRMPASGEVRLRLSKVRRAHRHTRARAFCDRGWSAGELSRGRQMRQECSAHEGMTRAQARR